MPTTNAAFHVQARERERGGKAGKQEGNEEIRASVSIRAILAEVEIHTFTRDARQLALLHERLQGGIDVVAASLRETG